MNERPDSKRVLRLNWVEGRPSLSGGVKSNRLIAEAMQRRGHLVTTPVMGLAKALASKATDQADPKRYR